MVSSTDGIKIKNKRATRRGCTTAFGCLLVMFIAPFALIRAWEGFCAIPTELPLSEESIQVVSSLGHSEVELLQQLYHELSTALAWHGTVVSIWPYEFRYHCRADSCALTYAHIWARVRHPRICTFSRRLNTAVVETYIWNIDRGELDIQFDQWRASGRRIPIPKPDWHEISSDIAATKEYVLNSIGSDEWNAHSPLSIKLHPRKNGWSVKVSSIFSGELIYRADVDRSVYRNKLQQKQ